MVSGSEYSKSLSAASIRVYPLIGEYGRQEQRGKESAGAVRARLYLNEPSAILSEVLKCYQRRFCRACPLGQQHELMQQKARLPMAVARKAPEPEQP